MAICTNNVREWKARWRAMLPVGVLRCCRGLGFVAFAARTAHLRADARAPGVDAGATLFIDDIEINCDAARELGLRTVWFRSTEQAIEEIETALMESD